MFLLSITINQCELSLKYILIDEKERKEKELEDLSSKTVEQMWLKDLEELEVGYSAFMEATIYTEKSELGSKVVGGASSSKVKKVKQGKNE